MEPGGHWSTSATLHLRSALEWISWVDALLWLVVSFLLDECSPTLSNAHVKCLRVSFWFINMLCCKAHWVWSICMLATLALAHFSTQSELKNQSATWPVLLQKLRNTQKTHNLSDSNVQKRQSFLLPNESEWNLHLPLGFKSNVASPDDDAWDVDVIERGRSLEEPAQTSRLRYSDVSTHILWGFVHFLQ